MLAVSSPAATHLPMLVVIGLAVFLGTVGARGFQILRIPQVVAYILSGVVIGHALYEGKIDLRDTLRVGGKRDAG